MVFFHPKFYNNNSDASFVPLFRLLEDFDKHYNQQPALPKWQPKFDVRETEQTFELHGEFPGVDKENVNITFTDPQTILIHGKTERSYASDRSAAAAEEVAGKDAVDDSDKHSTSSYQATVEDDFEEVAENGQEALKSEPQQVEKTQPAESKPAAPEARYWLTERSIGEFSRSFHFPSRVEQEGTTANFQDGILTVVVPKAKKHEARRIAIN